MIFDFKRVDSVRPVVVCGPSEPRIRIVIAAGFTAPAREGSKNAETYVFRSKSNQNSDHVQYHNFANSRHINLFFVRDCDAHSQSTRARGRVCRPASVETTFDGNTRTTSTQLVTTGVSSRSWRLLLRASVLSRHRLLLLLLRLLLPETQLWLPFTGIPERRITTTIKE